MIDLHHDTMQASVLRSARQIELDTRPIPVPDRDQVLVRVGSVGVCGSDVHYFSEGRIGDFVLEAPMVLGHEAGGTIVAVGSEVDSSRIGSRVSIEPQRPSSLSREVLAGAYNLDPAMEFYATPPIDGAFAEYVAIQSAFAHDVPDEVSDDAAALLEPLSVGIATARKAGFTVGSRVFIAGAGPIGIITAQVARAYGASEIYISDLDADRRERALRFGATHALDPVADAARIRELGVDSFVDASGSPRAVVDGIRALRPAGVAVLVGMGPDEYPVPIGIVQARELVVTGVFRYANTWPTAIELARSGRVDLDGMATARYGLGQVEEALAASLDSANLKVIVEPGRA